MKIFICLIILLMLPLLAFSQLILKSEYLVTKEKRNMFAVEVGYLHSLTNVKVTPGTLIGIGKIYNKPGFYFGLYYETNLSKSFTILSEISYQNKGNRAEALNFSTGNFVKITNNYHYLSISALIKLVSLYECSMLIGPEFTLLTDAVTSDRNLERIELGLTGRISYPTGKFILSASYFKGLNKYDRVGSGNYYFALYNSNIRLGINYIINK